MIKLPREDSIDVLLPIISSLIKRKKKSLFVKEGYKITIEQWFILEVLNENGTMNMSALAKIMRKQNANITRMVDKLEQDKLLLRKPELGDRRAHLICLTDKGSGLFYKLAPVVIEAYKDITSFITREEEKMFLQVCKKLINNLT